MFHSDLSYLLRDGILEVGQRQKSYVIWFDTQNCQK